MSGQLGKQAARGAALLGVSQGVRIACSFLSTIVLARLLLPGDFGVVAMVAPITGFILIFQDLGLNQAVVQSRSVSDGQVNALFWWNVVASCVIAVAFVAISPLVSLFYGDNRAGQMAAFAGIPVIINGLGLQHAALLNREMRFFGIAAAEIANSLVTIIAMTILAVLLRNYWALFLGPVAGTIASTVVLWRNSPWRPQIRARLDEARDLLSFGANIAGFNLFNYIGRNADNVLIAKLWGAAELGLYDRCYRLMMFPLQTINGPLARVMLPSLSRLRDEPDQYRRVYITAINTLTAFAVPGAVTAALCSGEIIEILLGKRWAGAEAIFFWLGLASVIQPVANATGWLFVSSGRAKEMMHWGLISTAVQITGFAIGVQYGAVGVATSYFLTQLLRVPFLFAWSTRTTPVKARDLFASLLPPIAAGAILAPAVIELRHFVPGPPLIGLTAVASYALSFGFQTLSSNGRMAIGQQKELLSGLWAGVAARLPAPVTRSR